MYIKRPQIRSFLFLYLSIFLSIFMFICLSIYLSFSFFVSLSLFFPFLSLSLFLFSRTIVPFFLCIGAYTRVCIRIYIYTRQVYSSYHSAEFEESQERRARFGFLFFFSTAPVFRITRTTFSEPLMTSLEKGRAIRVPIRRIVILYVSI